MSPRSGHVYFVGNCGNPEEEVDCPASGCNERIGGFGGLIATNRFLRVLVNSLQSFCTMQVIVINRTAAFVRFPDEVREQARCFQLFVPQRFDLSIKMCRFLVILFRHHTYHHHTYPDLHGGYYPGLLRAAIYTGLPANLKQVRKTDCISLIFAPR